jgi:hypothetical protein
MNTCKVCGCTDNQPCFMNADGKRLQTTELEAMPDEQLERLDLVPCYWIQPDLCSGCVVEPPAPMLFDAFDRPLRGTP